MTERDTKLRSIELRSIDAWRDPGGGWTWNDSYSVGPIEVSLDVAYNPRKLLRLMRAEGYLSEDSKGRVRVQYIEGDPTYIEIQEKSLGEPLFALILPWSEVDDDSEEDHSECQVCSVCGADG